MTIDNQPDMRLDDVRLNDVRLAAGADTVQLLTENGDRLSDVRFDAWISDIGPEQLLGLYEDMLVIRRIDAEATALQRQGELGLWPPLLGQEASQIGSGRALRSDDFVFSSYREHGVAYCRGAGLVDLLRVWRGTTQSGWNPYDITRATPQVIIGAQTLHATGYALGIPADGSDAVAVAYFGDGATSEGDVTEAMIFAATYAAPVIFFCQNNQYAISEPVGLQAQRPIAERAPGFGIPSVRVDGNDVLAVMAVMRSALDRARSGGGPTFIEAVTYRVGPHTTADDPSRYRDPAEVEAWRGKDPVSRVEAHLGALGMLTQERLTRIQEKADRVAAEMRTGIVALQDPDPLTVFDNVYAEPHTGLARQRDHYSRYLRTFVGGDGR